MTEIILFDFQNSKFHINSQNIFINEIDARTENLNLSIYLSKVVEWKI